MSNPVRAAVSLAPDPVLTRRDDLLDDEVVAIRLGELLHRVWGDGRTGDCTRLRKRASRSKSARSCASSATSGMQTTALPSRVSHAFMVPRGVAM